MSEPVNESFTGDFENIIEDYNILAIEIDRYNIKIPFGNAVFIEEKLI